MRVLFRVALVSRQDRKQFVEMVKIAIAGASSRKLLCRDCSDIANLLMAELAREVLDKLVETRKHEIIALNRKVAVSTFRYSSRA